MSKLQESRIYENDEDFSLLKSELLHLKQRNPENTIFGYFFGVKTQFIDNSLAKQLFFMIIYPSENMLWS